MAPWCRDLGGGEMEDARESAVVQPQSLVWFAGLRKMPRFAMCTYADRDSLRCVPCDKNSRYNIYISDVSTIMNP